MIQGIVNEYEEQDMIQTNEMEEINQIFIDQLEVPATIILQQGIYVYISYNIYI